jgi:hypothetical protein
MARLARVARNQTLAGKPAGRATQRPRACAAYDSNRSFPTNHSSARSSHSGLNFSISFIFQRRLHFFSRFSR